MISISRHRVDMAFIEEQAERSLRIRPRDIEYARDEPTPFWLYGAFQRCLDDVRYWSFFDETGSSERINRSLLLAAHAGTAIFRSVSTQEKSIQVWLDGPLEVRAFMPESFTSPGFWMHTFYSAVISREYDLVDRLSAVPPQIFMGGSDDFYYSWAANLQAFWRMDADLPDYFEQTLDDIDRREIASKRTVNLLIQPQILLCKALLTGDPDIFNGELANALQAHRKFFGTTANKHDPLGFLSLPAIAFAALAHGIGIPITVESGYLLQYQITRPQTLTIPALQNVTKQGNRD